MKQKIKSMLNQNIIISVSIAVVNTLQKQKKNNFLTKNIEIQNEIMENQIEKQNIGMSVDIDIEVTENEIKNKFK